MVVPSDVAPSWTHARLTFVPPAIDALAEACIGAVRDGGVGEVVLLPQGELARELCNTLAGPVRAAGARLTMQDDAPRSPDRVSPGSSVLVVVCSLDAGTVADALVALVDADVAVIAPETSRLGARHPLFLISIPKAGTHLLYALAESMGYASAVVLNGDPAPGHWYCVEYSNSHTVARDFFVDTVRRSPYGNRHHSFMRSPALFIYRNPLDVVASEASYYHRAGKTAFAGYLAGLSDEARLLRLIDDPWLLGSIRDRIGGFAPWLELPNVIPVSFEELVGERGGGSREVQQRTVWSIQLRLQIPGTPATFAEALFREDSPTFDAARIGRYRDTFTPEAHRRFRALPQDFMQRFGFGSLAVDEVRTIPDRAAEFRYRPVRLLETPVAVPIAVEQGYMGCNIIRVGSQYAVVRQSAGLVTLQGADLDLLAAQGTVVLADTHEAARRAAERLVVQDECRRLLEPMGAVEPALVAEDCFGFNIVRYRSRYWAIAQGLGELNWATADLNRLLESDALFAADTMEGVSAQIARHRHAAEDRARNLQLTQELDAARSRIEALAAERDSEARQGLEDRARNLELTQELDAARSRIVALAAEHESDARQLLEDRARNLQERDAARSHVEALAAERDSERQQRLDERTRNLELAQELEAVRIRIDEQQRRAETLESELATANAAIAQSEVERTESARAAQELSHTLTREQELSSAIASSLTSERAAFADALSAANDVVGSLRSTVHAQAAESAELRDWIQQLHATIAESKARSGQSVQQAVRQAVSRARRRWLGGRRRPAGSKPAQPKRK